MKKTILYLALLLWAPLAFAGITLNSMTSANETDMRSNVLALVRTLMGFNQGFVTNNGVIFYVTNGVPQIPAPDGSIGVGTGQIYTRTNGAWVGMGGGSGGGSGEANTASNLGSNGVGAFWQKVGVDLQFKSFVGSGGAVVTTNATNVIIAAGDLYSGQANHFTGSSNIFDNTTYFNNINVASTLTISNLQTGEFESTTNAFAGTIVSLNTNDFTIITGTDIGFTDVANAPSGAVGYSVVHILASGSNINITNSSKLNASDFQTSRVLTNGTQADFMFQAQLGAFTNSFFVRTPHN